MSSRAGYTFLQKSWIRAELQHLLIIIGFYDQVVCHAHIFAYCFGNMADIRCQRELMIAIFDIIADIISTVMRNLESGNAEIANHKRHFFFDHLTRTDKLFLHVAALVDSPVDSLRRIDRDTMFFSQTTYGFDMISMIMRDQNCNNFGEIDRFIFQHLLYGTNTDTCIN